MSIPEVPNVERKPDESAKGRKNVRGSAGDSSNLKAVSPDELLGEMPRASTHADEIMQAAEDELNNSLDGEGGKSIKKRKRRTKAQMEAEKIVEKAAEITPEKREILINSCGMIFKVMTAIPAATVHPKCAAQPDEVTLVGTTAAELLISKGYSDIPPGLALVLAVGFYVLRCVSDSEVKEAIRARFDKRRNRNRQNHLGEDHGPASGPVTARAGV